MSRRRLFITIGLWAVLLIALNGVVAAYAWQRMHPHVELQQLWQVPQFSLTDQENRPVTDENLRGKVWIADFIFTQCAGSCPMMSSKMADLQARLKGAGVELISFSVDPVTDTPAVLKQYAQRYKADSSRWKFLTGSVHQINDVEVGMKIAVEPPKGNDPLLHSTHFLLVDGQGQVRGIYDNNEINADKGMDQLVKDAKALAEGKGAMNLATFPFPPVNAALNGLSGVLLVAALICIKTRRIKSHVALVIAALLSSAIFLTSYLIFHTYRIRHGIPITRYPSDQPLRWLYISILTSHTILAVVILPLIVITVVQAASKQWRKHRLIAQWTFPLWLYVSITGVVVYVMLSASGAYHVKAAQTSAAPFALVSR